MVSRRAGRTSRSWSSGKVPTSCLAQALPYITCPISSRSVPRLSLQFPLLLLRLFSFLLRYSRSHPGHRVAIILTHFSTFPFAWIAPQCVWYCFNQDVEWMFVKAGLRRVLLRWFILATSRRSRVITTNAYVEGLYEREGIRAFARLSIWASKFWLTTDARGARDIDVVMLLRRGHMKRLDLYVDILKRIKLEGFTTLMITPDADIFEDCKHLVTHSVLRPSDQELRKIYQRAKVFLLLSDTEGFSLPPLEAMGSGCVPLCRDSGGPRSYMTGAMAANLISLELPTPAIVDILARLLDRPEALLVLSEAATEVFVQGAETSLRVRDECFATLTNAFRGSHDDDPPGGV